MEGPNFLNRALYLKIEPGNVLMNSLTEMNQISNWAVLVVTGTKRFQIVAFSEYPRQSACAMLEMNSDFIDAPSISDGYCLHFRIDNWLQLFSDPIAQEPSTSLSIFKVAGSMDLYCSFGNGQPTIQLRDAQFVKAPGIHMIMNNSPCRVRVSMGSEQFRDFINDFATKCYYPVCAVQMLISRANIRWITPLQGNFDRSAADYSIRGLRENGSFQFGLRWDSALFSRLIWVATRWEHVELSVFEICRGVNMYRICFFIAAQSYYFGYIPEMLLHYQGNLR